MHKLVFYIAMIGIILGLGLVGLGTYWIIYPYQPITINNAPYPVLDKTVKQGDHIVYTANFCKNDNSPVIITRTFVDGIIYRVPSETANRPMGCYQTNLGIAIPKSLPVGKYSLHVTYAFQVNPLRTVTLEANTESFDVIK